MELKKPREADWVLEAEAERGDAEEKRKWMDRHASVLERVSDEEQNAAALGMDPEIHVQLQLIDQQHDSALNARLPLRPLRRSDGRSESGRG